MIDCKNSPDSSSPSVHCPLAMWLCSSSHQEVEIISQPLKLGLATWLALHCKQSLVKCLHNEACLFIALLGTQWPPLCEWAHWSMSNICSEKGTVIVPASMARELTAMPEGVQPTPCGAAVPLAQPIYHTQHSSISTSKITLWIIAIINYQSTV